MSIITTIVGSYPTETFEAESFNDKLTKSLGLFDPYKQSIINSVEAFVKADIDIICDGQVRGDMVKIFTSKINGCEIRDNTVYINGKITPPAHPISVNDFKLTYKTAHNINSNYQLHTELDSIFEGESKGVKGVLTGPTTLIHSSKIEKFYTCNEHAIYDMARVLEYEALELQKAGACAIQIDEPFISIGVEDIEVSKNAIEIITDSLDIPVVLHVCGDLKDVFSRLLDFKVDFLDFEFSGMPENIDTLKRDWRNDCNKNLGIGCVNTKLESVDNIDDVKKTIKEVNSVIKKDNLMIDPDCGMRMLEDDIALGKLELLRDIKKEGI